MSQKLCRLIEGSMKTAATTTTTTKKIRKISAKLCRPIKSSLAIEKQNRNRDSKMMFVERFKLSFVIFDFIPVWRLPMAWSLNNNNFCFTLILDDFQYFFFPFIFLVFPIFSRLHRHRSLAMLLSTPLIYDSIWFCCLVAGNVGHVFHFLISSIRFIYLYFCLIFFFCLGSTYDYWLRDSFFSVFFLWAFVISPTLNTTRELTLGKFDNYISYGSHVMINSIPFSLPSRLCLWSQELRTSKINNQIIINKEVAEKKKYGINRDGCNRNWFWKWIKRAIKCFWKNERSRGWEKKTVQQTQKE